MIKWLRLLPAAAVVTAIGLAPLSVAGQTSTAQAKTWVPARTPDGQPDMQGYWDAVGRGSYYIEERPDGTKSQIVDPPDGKVPYQPWALLRRQENLDHYIDPFANCFPSGVPRQVYSPRGHQVLQTPGYVLIVSEWAHVYRVIPLDTRPHLGPRIKLFMGDSRGHWEGNTLIVDSTNFNGKTWLSVVGDFHSDALHVVERFTPVDANTIRYEAVVEDPKVYTRPWKMAFSWVRMEKGHETWEEPCNEGNEDLKHFHNLGFKSYFGVTPPRN